MLLLTAGCSGESQPAGPARGTLTITGERPVTVDVQIAESPADRERGLMGVEALGERQGMVFLLNEPTRSEFTMRDTLIPLSLGVWGPDQRLSAVLDMDPCEAEPCPAYDPGVTWIGAVEVNQGFFDDHGVGVGDRVRLERSPSDSPPGD